MTMKEVKSFQEFKARIKDLGKAYLLLYKGGNEKSDCAFYNVRVSSEAIPNLNVFHADVSSTPDIHEKFGITTVPALLEFRDGEFINNIKGCNDISQYKALFENTQFHAERKEEGRLQKRVTVYSTPTCSWCNTLKSYFKLHNIAYTDIDVSRDQKAADALVKRSGQMGVPQTDVNGELIIGFNKPRLNQLLGIKD